MATPDETDGLSAPDPFSLVGRRALVTGSSRGIGLAMARSLAAAGADVVVHGRDPEVLDQAVAEVRTTARAEVTGVRFDVTDEREVIDAVRTVEAGLGPIDILVNNVGIQKRAPFTEFPTEDWHALLAANLTSAFLVGREVTRAMVTRGHGKVVNVGSVQSLLGRPSIAPYAATKGGIVMLTKGMCADLAGHGIQVNALAPGYIETDLTRALVEDEEFSAWVRARTPAGRWGTVDDLTGALRFLVSPASDFVNGQVLHVDGGMTAVV